MEYRDAVFLVLGLIIGLSIMAYQWMKSEEFYKAFGDVDPVVVEVDDE